MQVPISSQRAFSSELTHGLRPCHRVPCFTPPTAAGSLSVALVPQHQWRAYDAELHRTMLAHHRMLAASLDRFLPCRGFYNYIDNEKPCALNNDAWLGAYFSDVGRMKAIKASLDPRNVFRSRLFAPRRTTVAAVAESFTMGGSPTYAGRTWRGRSIEARA
eukprot:4149592-Pleurochrysis_carterae.AAC.1